MNQKPARPRKAILYCLMLPGAVLMLAGSLMLPRTFNTHLTLLGLSGAQIILLGGALLVAGIALAKATRKPPQPD